MLGGFLDRHADKAHALLRMVVGFLFALHGTSKLFGWPPSEHGQPEMWSQHWWGGVIELGAGALVFFGLFTRLASFVASGEMAVAYFQFHWKVLQMPFTWNFDGAFEDNRWVPAVNEGEMAVLYCFLFLYFVFAGGRRCSVDRLLQRRRLATSTSPY